MEGESVRTVLEVKGMHCEGCENRIKAALDGKKNVKSVAPDHRKNEVAIEHEGAEIEELAKIIAGLGYEVKEPKEGG